MAKKKKSLAKHLRKKRKQKMIGMGTNVPDLPTIPPMPLIPQVMTDQIVEKLNLVITGGYAQWQGEQ